MDKLSHDRTPELQTQFHPSFNLEPIRTMDSGFFHSHGIKEISRIVLLQLAFVIQNGFHHLHVIAADDLLLSLLSFGPESFPIPKHAILTRALFSFHFSCQPRPRTAEIILPNTLKLQEPADAPIISGWFARAGFSLAQNLRHCIIIALLIIATALDPASPADGDDGDDDHHYTASTLCVSAA